MSESTKTPERESIFMHKESDAADNGVPFHGHHEENIIEKDFVQYEQEFEELGKDGNICCISSRSLLAPHNASCKRDPLMTPPETEMHICTVNARKLSEMLKSHYSTPLPNTEEFFPWAHGLKKENYMQRAFFAKGNSLDRERSPNRSIDYDDNNDNNDNDDALEEEDLPFNETCYPKNFRGIVVVDINFGDCNFKYKIAGSININEVLQKEQTKDNSLVSFSGAKHYLPKFLDLDPPSRISIRNFYLQVSKMCRISDFIVYSSNPKTAFSEIEMFAKKISKAQDLYRSNIESDTILYRTYVIPSQEILDFISSPCNLDLPAITLSSYGTNAVYNPLEKMRITNDPQLKQDLINHEKNEMSKMSQATPISTGIWLGNSMDCEFYNGLKFRWRNIDDTSEDHIKSIHYLKTRNWITFMDCRSNFRTRNKNFSVTLPQLDQYIRQAGQYLKQQLDIRNGKTVFVEKEIIKLNSITIKLPSTEILIQYSPMNFMTRGWNSSQFNNFISGANFNNLNLSLNDLMSLPDNYTYNSQTEFDKDVLKYEANNSKGLSVNSQPHLHPNVLRSPSNSGISSSTPSNLLTTISHPICTTVSRSNSHSYSLSHTNSDTNSSSDMASNTSEHSRSYSNASLVPYDDSWFFNNPLFDGNFPSKILPYIYLGSLKHAENFKMLKNLGVKRIISVGERVSWVTNDVSRANWNDTLRLSHMDYEEYKTKIKYLRINDFSDDGIDLITPHISECLDFINQSFEQKEIVLVHCRVGVSRSAGIVICEVMNRYKMNLINAYLFVRVRRLNTIIQPNLKLFYELLRFEQELKLKAESECEENSNSKRTSFLRDVDWHIICREVTLLNKNYVVD
ncbi:hypothetical protein NADFUDRAFT_49796 [Nadsonia fulvescens var. elongata DSM 6958]|uniref:Uncharacterized protein n=1 Tax=Nadsonia fulvescens var. elongata DSM 6958 TaxID=857566 RepID=A0A1E3PPL9_9ASCO|nr:hypothetical protein NADFUDRAFT_49796 [Nadsonia fulvescens var. elongata DSM 6958]